MQTSLSRTALFRLASTSVFALLAAGACVLPDQGDERALLRRLAGYGVDVKAYATAHDDRVIERWGRLGRVALGELGGASGGGWLVILDDRHVSPEGRVTPVVWSTLQKLSQRSRIRGLVLKNTRIRAIGLQLLSELPRLEFVDLSGTSVDDNAIAHLTELGDTRTLDLSVTEVTAAGVTHLQRLTRLRTLVVNGRMVNDDWLRALRKLVELEELHVADAELSDDVLGHLAVLKNLRGLNLGGTLVTGEGLEQLDQLRLLSLYGTMVTDSGIASVQGLRHLLALDLEFCGTLSNAGLAHLKKLRGLRALSIRQTGFEKTPFTGEALQQISGLDGLEVLDLYGTHTDDAALAHLSALVELRELDLSLTTVTDAGMAVISGLPRLEKLSLDFHEGFSGPTITDEGLKHLENLDRLEYVSLVGARLTETAVRRLSRRPRPLTVRREGDGAATTPLSSPSAPLSTGSIWPGWRGQNRNAISNDTGLRRSWTNDRPALVWSASGLGKGYASVAVTPGGVFTLGKKNDNVLVVCLSGAGRKLWEKQIGTTKRNAMSTPVVDSGLVFALDPAGKLACVNAQTGNGVWAHDLVADFGGRTQSGRGYGESPLIDGVKLICTPGGNDAALVALEKTTGQVIWKSSVPAIGSLGRDGAAFSSPISTHVGDRRIYIQLIGRGVVGVDAGDGEFLFGYNRVANGTANIPTPVVLGNLVFSSTGYGVGSALLELVTDGEGGLKANEKYFLGGGTFQNQHGGFVSVDGAIFGGHGNNNGFPTCIDVATGKVLWKARGPGTGSAAVAYADGHLYFRYQNGVMTLIEASRQGYKLKGTFQIPTAGNDSWAHPAIAGGRLYLREQDRLFVYDLRRKR